MAAEDDVTAIHVAEQEVASDLPFSSVDQARKSPDQIHRVVREHAPDWLWVQYSGYGFSRHATPWYLSGAMAALRKEMRVAVFVHETHCERHQLGWKGPILSLLQREASRRVVRAADLVFASSELYQQQILRDYGLAPERLVELPLGSSIHFRHRDLDGRDEIREQLGWRHDETVAVVFGSAGTQLQALQRNADALRHAHQADTLHRVVCIGGSRNVDRAAIEAKCQATSGANFEVMGHQPENTVADVMLASDVAITSYGPERFGKSSVFIAYSLAGLPVLVNQATVAPYRHARMITVDELSGLNSPTELDARAQRQQLAARDFSWQSIATTARKELLCR